MIGYTNGWSVYPGKKRLFPELILRGFRIFVNQGERFRRKNQGFGSTNHWSYDHKLDHFAPSDTMKTKFTVLSFVAFALLSTVVVVMAYHRGYQRGGDDERACWTLQPAPSEAWLHGVVTAIRDARKHPFFAPARFVIPRDDSINAIPVTYSR